MRSFSGLYFFLRPITYLLTLLPGLLAKYVSISKWFIYGTLFCAISLFTAFAKPYKKYYMNFLDALLLLYFGLLSFVFSSTWHKNTVLIARVLLSTPIILFFLVIASRISFTAIIKIFKVCRKKLKLLCICFRLKGTTLTPETTLNQNEFIRSQATAKPLIQPTSTVISYGANDNEVPITLD